MSENTNENTTPPTLYEDLQAILAALDIPNEMLLYRATPLPDTFAILTPIGSELVYASDEITHEIPEVRVVIYSKNNYRATVKSLIAAVNSAGLTVTESTFVDYDDESGFYSYAVGVEKAEIFNYDDEIG